LAGRAAHTVRREGVFPVGRVGELAVAGDVIVGAGDDADAVPVRVVRELLEIGGDMLGVRHVQPAVRFHEVVLGVDVPEDDAGHSDSPAELGRWGISTRPRPGSTPGYNLKATAISSQSCWRGQRAQSAQTLSGKAWRSSGRKSSR